MNLTDKESPDTSEHGPLRLQVYLAHAGVASRRACEGLISSGRVSVNGQVVTVLGTRVLPIDDIRLDGVALQIETQFHYLALNKPPMYICSSSDPQGRSLAKDLLPMPRERLYNVGRLDYRSSGLIIFTNDGDFAAKVSHPSAKIKKEYLVEATGPIPDTMIAEFQKGLEIEGVFYRSTEIERLGRKSIRVVLIEGKNREIRRVFSHFHLHPSKLHRIRIGPVVLGSLGAGESRALTEEEKEILLQRRA
ncbi:pseudouridine synthase [Treponema primitia]|uniref:pseudouridine synthase n=1 Tax=Treponema primitia TaxID=88058 RepID=UPI0002554E1D|nr:pseudouridine synthase [Treponema primitia]